jgi:hypothetical protein
VSPTGIFQLKYMCVYSLLQMHNNCSSNLAKAKQKRARNLRISKVSLNAVTLSIATLERAKTVQYNPQKMLPNIEACIFCKSMPEASNVFSSVQYNKRI